MRIEHIAMYVNDLERAKEFFEIFFEAKSNGGYHNKTTRLKEAGYDVVSGPRTTGDGYYESCIVGIEGNQIEITV